MTPLERFRAAVMADADAQASLARWLDPAAFEAEALDWSAARGILLSAEDLRCRPAPMACDGWPGAGWLPVSAATEIEWLHFAGEPLVRPFFEDDARRAATRPFNRLFRQRTPLQALTESAPHSLPVPDGLVFHMSRCGSTLVSQMLGAPQGHLAVSEAPPIDHIVQRSDLDDGQRIGALPAIVGAYGRGAAGVPGRWFVKLDSWHSRALPLFRRAFPNVPWVFLYREPIEVLVSHLRRPGSHIVPALVPPQVFGLTLEDATLPDATYAARVLERSCGAVLDHRHLGGGLLVDYRELPDAVFTRILPHFGAAPSDAEVTAMAAAASRDAKSPANGFTPDSAAKRREAPPEAHAAAERHLAAVYGRLKALGSA